MNDPTVTAARALLGRTAELPASKHDLFAVLTEYRTALHDLLAACDREDTRKRPSAPAPRPSLALFRHKGWTITREEDGRRAWFADRRDDAAQQVLVAHTEDELIGKLIAADADSSQREMRPGRSRPPGNTEVTA